MTLTIDSESVDLPPTPGESFKSYLNRVSVLLLEKGRCVGTCHLDGRHVVDIDEAQACFASAASFAVETVPLQVALQANIALQCNAMRRIEDACENLVTDALLGEPRQVASAWTALCEEVKTVLNFLPILNGLLTDQQLDALIDDRLASLNAIMKEIAEALNKADVVTFSDTLELKLMPWLGGMREFLQAQLTVVEALGKAEAAQPHPAP